MKNTTLATVVALLLFALAIGAWLWIRRPAEIPAPLPAASAPVAAASEAASATAAAATASAPAVRYPIETESAAPPAAPRDAKSVLSGLFGRKTVLSLFLWDDFARRFVATVDNLGRAKAPASLWPMVPAPGRFTVETQRDGQIIGADNGLRYSQHVLAFESVSVPQLVAAYRVLYPQLQQAYADLGYPNRYFNDRLVEVIDLLLATPVPAEPVQVRLPRIEGPLKPERPWVLYEFDDPALQALTAGQRILLRMGPVNQRRLKARLAELRRLLVEPAPRR